MRILQKALIIVSLIIISAGSIFLFLSRSNDGEALNNVAINPDAKEYTLSQPIKKGRLSIEEAIGGRRSVRDYSNNAVPEKYISQLLWAAQGITDSTTGFRTAPSAGALYPLEIYIAIGNVEDIETGLYKYNPVNHSLIHKKSRDMREIIYDLSLRQEWVKNSAAVIVYTAVFERTTRRYGERAHKYVYMEVGHSAQNVYLQAEALKMGTVAIGAFDDNGIKEALSLPQEEEPVYIMPVGPVQHAR